MLDEVLASILAVLHDARAVILVGLDGMIVAAKTESQETSWDLVAASHADLYRRAAANLREAALAEAPEIVLVGPDLSLVFRAVNANYALMVALGPEGCLGRARYEVRKASARLLPEL